MRGGSQLPDGDRGARSFARLIPSGDPAAVQAWTAARVVRDAL
jgi:hypothetical protein